MLLIHKSIFAWSINYSLYFRKRTGCIQSWNVRTHVMIDYSFVHWTMKYILRQFVIIVRMDSDLAITSLSLAENHRNVICIVFIYLLLLLLFFFWKKKKVYLFQCHNKYINSKVLYMFGIEKFRERSTSIWTYIRLCTCRKSRWKYNSEIGVWTPTSRFSATIMLSYQYDM